MDNKALGRACEALSADVLRKKGYRILHKNWRCLLGEIDIVARDRDFLVFVEIKARRTILFGPGYSSVNFAKQQKLIKLAKVFLKRYGLCDEPCRIDIVSIDLGEDSRAMDVELIKDAFWEDNR